MNKKDIVTMLLELTATMPLKSIPTLSDGSTIDRSKFKKVPEIAATIAILENADEIGKALVEETLEDGDSIVKVKILEV